MKPYSKWLMPFVTVYCFLVTVAIAETEQVEQGLSLEKVAEGLGIPWGLAFIDADTMVITEKHGAIRLLNVTTGALTTVDNVPKVAQIGQGGLLDIHPAPDYASSGWLYFTYSKAVPEGAATTLARAKLNDASLEDWQDLLVTDSGSRNGRHFGSRIAFEHQGHVFFSVGDRGDRDSVQNTENHQGTIIRLNLDGSVPSDNPFVDQPGFLPGIWSYGHRNPQGLAYDLDHDVLWSSEHGPRGGDEINRVEKGKNYGWPVISYGKEYWGPIAVGEGTEKAGMEQPVKYYVPSIAPGSLLYYDGELLRQWRGNLLLGALKLMHLNRVVLDENLNIIEEQRLLEDNRFRIRALAQSPQGLIYFSTDNGDIYRLKPRG